MWSVKVCCKSACFILWSLFVPKLLFIAVPSIVLLPHITIRIYQTFILYLKHCAVNIVAQTVWAQLFAQGVPFRPDFLLLQTFFQKKNSGKKQSLKDSASPRSTSAVKLHYDRNALIVALIAGTAGGVLAATVVFIALPLSATLRSSLGSLPSLDVIFSTARSLSTNSATSTLTVYPQPVFSNFGLLLSESCVVRRF